MKKINKLSIILCCFILYVNQLVSQITSGKIVYERKTNLYKKFKNNRDIREWIKEEDKTKTDVFELYFNDSLTVFKPEESDLVEKMSWTTTKNVVYQNFKTGYRLTEKKLWSELFLVSDTIRTFKWKITDSKRNISGYQCRKAIWQANDSIRVYAWFCNEIIPSVGPESFIGLPGAILGLATEDGGVIYFAKNIVVMKPDPNTLIPKKTKQKIYKTKELRAQLEKDFSKDKWGKIMIYNNFEIW